MVMQRREPRAMNSDIELVAFGPRASLRLARAERWLAAYEARFSRFRLLSELSLLNRNAGRPVRVSPPLLRLVELSLRFAERSGGLFDPTVLRALEAAGYDRSFEQIGASSARPRKKKPASSWRGVSINHAGQTITLPENSGIDLGGIGKGWAVDRMAAMLGTPCLVNGGGDVYAAGRPPGGDCWLVGIADPIEPARDIAVLRVVDRGVATSSTVKRRWRAGDALLHHLIDPRTGLPSESDAVQVSAVAASALLADFHAKVALLRGATAGLAYLNREPEVEGLIVRRDGSILQSDGLTAYLKTD